MAVVFKKSHRPVLICITLSLFRGQNPVRECIIFPADFPVQTGIDAFRYQLFGGRTADALLLTRQAARSDPERSLCLCAPGKSLKN
jgi:hypothetical protein